MSEGKKEDLARNKYIINCYTLKAEPVLSDEGLTSRTEIDEVLRLFTSTEGIRFFCLRTDHKRYATYILGDKVWNVELIIAC